jgi:UDP-N-acetylglucosamine acyltransferase
MFAERLNEVRHLSGNDPAIAAILDFIDAAKHRELCQPIKQRSGS